MRRLKHIFEYTAVRLAVGMVSLLPWDALPALAAWLGPWTQRALKSRQRLVMNNLRHAYPEMGEAELLGISKDFWRNILLTIFQIMKATPPRREWFLKNVTLDNPEVLEQVLRDGHGAILHSGHFANWEFAALSIAAYGYPVTGLVRTQKNPYINRWYNAIRCCFGSQIITHHQAVRETQEALARNRLLGILMDHNLHQGGIFVDFFGRPAATTTLTALLHYRTQSPIVEVYQYRSQGRLHLRFERYDLPQWNGLATRKDRAALLTQWLTSRTEALVRKDPANWLWGHNRWKRSATG